MRHMHNIDPYRSKKQILEELQVAALRAAEDGNIAHMTLTFAVLLVKLSDWSFEFIWSCSGNGRGLIGLFGSVAGGQKRPLSDAHAATTRPGGPVPRSGPDLARVVGTRRNASRLWELPRDWGSGYGG